MPTDEEIQAAITYGSAQARTMAMALLECRAERDVLARKLADAAERQMPDSWRLS